MSAQSASIALTSASFEAIAAAGIPTEFIVGMGRWTIYANSIRDGSGRYNGVGFSMQHKGIGYAPNVSAVWFTEIEDVIAFYNLLTRGNARKVLSGADVPVRETLPAGFEYGLYKA